ncbi:MAG: hypothetical protein K2Q25_08375 [Mycobacteriaceae bacterium]|nr:hypothetical protein [Mycobacteriaceae bacterium]
MLSGSTPRKGEGNGGGIGCLVVVVLVIGGLFLYQREGGKVFGPGGVIAPPKEPDPPLVAGLQSAWDTGTFSHDLVLTNNGAVDLAEVDVSITLFREDGEKVALKRFWSTWTKGEAKRVNVPAHRYQKEIVQGTAKRGGQKLRIDDTWTTNWR